MKDVEEKLIEIIPEGSRVLDLGCGGGELLQKLNQRKNTRGLGLEIDIPCIQSCVDKRVPVLKMDIDKGLQAFRDNQFDIALLYFTIQEVRNPLLVFNEMLRVSGSCIIVFSNFAYWRVRTSLLFGGKMPVTNQFPHSWYNTPNIHLLSVKDIVEMCKKEGVRINHQAFYGNALIDPLLIGSGLFNAGAATALIHMEKK